MRRSVREDSMPSICGIMACCIGMSCQDCPIPSAPPIGHAAEDERVWGMGGLLGIEFEFDCAAYGLVDGNETRRSSDGRTPFDEVPKFAPGCRGGFGYMCGRECARPCARFECAFLVD